MDIVTLKQIADKNPEDRTEKEQKIFDEYAVFFNTAKERDNESVRTRLLEQAQPHLEERTRLEARLKELESHPEVQHLLGLREELASANKELKEYKESSDACKTLSKLEKERRENASQLREIQKAVKSAGGEFTIPRKGNNKSSKKRTRSPEVEEGTDKRSCSSDSDSDSDHVSLRMAAGGD